MQSDGVFFPGSPYPPSSEHVSWCDIRALGGSAVGLPAHHFRLHYLLPVVLRVWEAACCSLLP